MTKTKVTRNQVKRVLRVLVAAGGALSHEQLAERCGMTPARLSAIMLVAQCHGLASFEPDR